MTLKQQNNGILILLIGSVFLSSSFANPTLTPGVWTDITPPGAMGYYINDVQFDPENHAVLYACVCQGPSAGLQKSTDAGSTWSNVAGSTLSSPQRVRVDPNNSNHLYVTQGVSANGFFVSNDGGVTMITPAGWNKLMDTIHENDIYYIAVDPADFNHILVVFYEEWSQDPNVWNNDTGNAGVVESLDGGNDWIVHQPLPEWKVGHLCNVTFLSNPSLGLGDSHTWMFSAQPSSGAGMWRTTNSGATWTKASSFRSHEQSTIIQKPVCSMPRQ